MNIHQMIDGEKPIYVKNVSRRKTGKDLLLMLEFKDKHGSVSKVKLLSTKYPVDIASLVAPRKLLGENADFLRLLNLGILELIPTEKAEEILDQPGAREALQREYEKREMTKGLSAPKTDKGLWVKGTRPGDESLPETDGVEYALDRLPPDHVIDGNAPEVLSDFEAVHEPGVVMLAKGDGVSPRIAQLMATLQEDPSTKNAALADLQVIDEEAISNDDLGYIIDKARRFAPITSWARNVLASRQPAQPTRRSKKRRRGRSL